ncbi:MAG: sulfurtransferase [Betaproteobacteria bacterium]|nr:sulfurtransferase [Betaproteobacteria bacterium]
MNEPLISTALLALRLQEWLVLDCRHSLLDTGAGRRAYLTGHIPGAHFLHLDQDLSGPVTGQNGRHPLPTPEAFAETLGKIGVDSARRVVAYDDMGGIFAARLWWMMRWLGHDRVSVLDGGWQCWVAEDRPVNAQIPQPQRARFYPEERAGRIVDTDFVLHHLQDPAMCLIDARAADRFRGENETLDPVAGHIPGARNRFFRDNLDSEGRFKPPLALKTEFEALLGGKDPVGVVHQCGSGVTACHNLLAMEYAGIGPGQLYPGSWSAWCADPSRPVALGSS